MDDKKKVNLKITYNIKRFWLGYIYHMTCHVTHYIIIRFILLENSFWKGNRAIYLEVTIKIILNLSKAFKIEKKDRICPLSKILNIFIEPIIINSLLYSFFSKN